MNRGMTLLEVLVSMVILGLVTLGMFATFSLVGKGPGKLGTLELQAMNYARETLEILKNSVSVNPVHSGLLNAGSHNDNGTLSASFKNAPLNGARTYDVEDIDINGDTITDYKRVTVTVTWDD